jgi:hypothetical protein
MSKDKTRKETVRANKKQYVLKHTKDKLAELDGKKTTPKKKNLIKKLKTLLKWIMRKTHARKRDKGVVRKEVKLEINEDE